MSLFVFTVVLVCVEAGLFLVVKLQRRGFPWLITSNDEYPVMDAQALQKFLHNSFDPDLGWVRRPNTSGTEKGQKGTISYHIDASGSRANQNGHPPPRVAVFGDSYAFCRQVADDETWEAWISKIQGYEVLNYGVGNYGVDQALMRYEGMEMPDTITVAVLAFVPETISRIQSYWKHYLEFGNTFAFKPRFVLDHENRLVLLENVVRNAGDFAAYRDKLSQIQENDRFYRTKFRSLQFRFPYILSLMRNPLRQIRLISVVGVRGMFRVLGIANQKLESLPFALIMRSNLRDAYRLYDDIESVKLLKAILLRFKQSAERRGHTPLVVLMPQMLDLKMNNNKTAPYQKFYREMAGHLPVLDLTGKFDTGEIEQLYINDQYGGHLSVAGNRFAAEEISNWLKREMKSNC